MSEYTRNYCIVQFDITRTKQLVTGSLVISVGLVSTAFDGYFGTELFYKSQCRGNFERQPSPTLSASGCVRPAPTESPACLPGSDTTKRKRERRSRSPFCLSRRRRRRRRTERLRNGRVVLTLLSRVRRSFASEYYLRRARRVRRLASCQLYVISRFPLNYRAEQSGAEGGLQSVDLIDTSSERCTGGRKERGRPRPQPPGNARLDGKMPE